MLSILNFSDYLTVLAAMIEFPMMLLLTAVIKKSDAKTLLGKEIRGINRKEYEYAIQSDNRVKAFSKRHRALQIAYGYIRGRRHSGEIRWNKISDRTRPRS